jgi:uncharacterized LabA/DUF88 family protein
MGIQRATVFVDGANIHHALKTAGVRANRIDPYKVAKKLVESRTLVQMRYYVAEIESSAPERLYRAHLAMRGLLERRADVRICTGHIQSLRETNPCAKELASYLARLPFRLPARIYQDLIGIASRHKDVILHREKGVDVFLACDLVDLARQDRFDVAYLVSGDADFCPAVGIVRSAGKRVFVASPDIAARLIRSCDVAIRLEATWFADCQISMDGS